MLLSDVKVFLDSYKPGSFLHITWKRDISSAKARKQGITILKTCSGVFRTGINYNNIQSVTPSTSEHTSWFEHCGKGLLQSKSTPEKKYLQVFSTLNKNQRCCVTTNSDISDFNTLYEMGLITKADMPKADRPVVFTLNISDIECLETKSVKVVNR